MVRFIPKIHSTVINFVRSLGKVSLSTCALFHRDIRLHSMHRLIASNFHSRQWIIPLSQKVSLETATSRLLRFCTAPGMIKLLECFPQAVLLRSSIKAPMEHRKVKAGPCQKR